MLNVISTRSCQYGNLTMSKYRAGSTTVHNMFKIVMQFVKFNYVNQLMTEYIVITDMKISTKTFQLNNVK